VGKWEDLENLEYEYTSSGEKRYNCPYCIDVRGKHDTDKKLFVNEELGKGYCFKCNSVVFKNNKSYFSGDESNIYEEPKQNIDLLLEKLAKQELELSWLSSVESGSQEVKDYLLNLRGIKGEYNEQPRSRDCGVSAFLITLSNQTTKAVVNIFFYILFPCLDF
jgi:hypothetical protein